MREVTVRVPLEESLDLLERPARACIGFVEKGRPHLEPVEFRHVGGRYHFGVERGAAPESSTEVVLVVDEGVLFFKLRAVYVRGSIDPVDSALQDGRIWFEVHPVRVSSWNYGRMRWKRD